MNSIDYQVTAAIAALCVIGWGMAYAVRGTDTGNITMRWVFPAALSLAFAAFSLFAMRSDGPLGFWPEHIDGVWGNQIFFDLLFCAGSAFFLAVPRLRAAGMRPLAWFVAIAATGGIAVLAMIARLLFLERARA